MNKEIKDIAMWEETDSELAKYTIQQLLKTYDDLEEQYKTLRKKVYVIIEYCKEITSREIDISDTDYDLGEDSVARDILDILKGKYIKEIPQFEGTLEQLDKLSIRGNDD